jgi:hypothetical protein
MASNETFLPTQYGANGVAKTLQEDRIDHGAKGTGEAKPLQRAEEVDDVSILHPITSECSRLTAQLLLKAVQSLIIPFIRSADEDATTKATGRGQSASGEVPRASLVELYKPEKLVKLMNFDLPNNGAGKEGLLATVQQMLQYSVNTWDQGFLDKLYSSTNAVGVISELLLAVLNTNVNKFFLPVETVY